MNEAASLAKWVAETPDRALLLCLLLFAIWFLWRRSERQGKDLRELYQKSEERGERWAVMVDRNTTLFDRILRRLDGNGNKGKEREL